MSLLVRIFLLALLLLCVEARAGRVLLVWDGNPYYEEVTAYRIFEEEGSDLRLIGEVRTNRAVILGVTLGNHCYVVTAVNQFGESDPSPKQCIEVLTAGLGQESRLDQESPQSRVALLPEESEATFDVNWSGEDEQGGSGLQEFDVYVSEDGGPYMRWLRGTKQTHATYTGLEGARYAFYSVASDVAGNREVPPGIAQAQTRTRSRNTPPWFLARGTLVADVGQSLSIPNLANDAEVPRLQRLSYSLVASEGTSAMLDSETGLLSWTPTPIFAGKTLNFKVRVTDNGEPSLSATQTVNVVVRDYFEIELGSAVVRNGSEATVPVWIFSSFRNWKASFSMETPGVELDWAVLTPATDILCQGEARPMGAQRWSITAEACATASTRVYETVAQLQIILPDTRSEVVPLNVKNLVVTKGDGTPHAGGVSRPGRVVFLSEEPILDLVPDKGGVALYLYGNPGSTYALESNSDGSPISVRWLEIWQGTLSQDYQRFFIPTRWSKQSFFRVRQVQP